MKIETIAKRFNVAASKLCKLRDAGLLKADADPIDAIMLAQMRRYLANHRPLSVEQLLMLADDPDLLSELGTYEARAQSQLKALGDLTAGAAPREVSFSIMGAHGGGEKEIEAIAGWLRAVLPEKPVAHAWIATRLLITLPTNLREYNAPKITHALVMVRAAKSFEGFSFQKIVKKRATIFYSQRQKFIDL